MHYDDWKRILKDDRLPYAMVDLDAVASNAETLLGARRREGVTFRIASKSIRVPALLRYIQELGGNAVFGIMTFSASEVGFLVQEGFDHLLMGYPVSRMCDALEIAKCCAAGKDVIATVDSPEHIALLARAANELNTTIALCIDIDLSLRLGGGQVHLGVRRSAVRDVARARKLAGIIADTKGVELKALLAYEAQVAGMPDRSPGQRLLDPIKQIIKKRSVELAAKRRADILDALRTDGHHVEVVNGGGTGSIASTSMDRSVTEVTVGSGFLCSHLFDHYKDLSLRPAAFFAVPICRTSDTGFVTAFGGGYVASGAVGNDRIPQVHLPEGLSPLSLEGWGEVQTPFACGSKAPLLTLGDPIIARHAKAGELFEHFDEVLLIQDGNIVDRVETYRGKHRCF